MARYSYEFKKQVVNAYLNGAGGYTYLAEKYGVQNRRQVLNWVHYYQYLGDEGLLRSRKNQVYSFEYKLYVVELYLTKEVSYQELALAEGINNSTIVARWVNDFRIAGPEALRPRKKGRKKTLDKTFNDKQIKKIEQVVAADTSIEHIKKLEDELLKLRIENAYLKELRRVHLEEEALLKEQRESYTASEETLN